MTRIALAALGVALASTATAQQPRSSAFYLLAGNDTILVERVTRAPGRFEGEFVDRNRGGRLTYAATLTPDGLITNLQTTYAAANGAPQKADFVFTADSVVVDANGTTSRLAKAAGALANINPSSAFIEQMLMHAKAIGGPSATFPLFMTLGGQSVPAIVKWIGTDSATIAYAGVEMHVAVSPSGELLGGGIPAQGVRIVRGPAVASITGVIRDYSAPPGAPYTAEEVTVRAPAGNKLAGTLTLPRQRPSGRVPAVVTITGSGSQDRDEGTPVLKGYRLFGEIADTLGRRGIAVLRLDDRGVGGSDMGPQTVTSADFANDIRAGIAYLRSRPEIDPDRIALVGHSEGGIIAPMIASTDPRLRAIVVMAGSASTGRAILKSQQEYVVDSMAHLTGAQREAALAQYARNTDSVAGVLPWMKYFLEYDPSVAARQVKLPVLIVHGEKDFQVPVTEANLLATAIRSGGNSRVTVRTFPSTNHLFVADPVGSFSYEKLPSLRIRPEVLGTIADWLATTLR